MVARDQRTPEEAQEQNRPLLQDLSHYYDMRAEDNASFLRVRERLLQKAATSLPVADTDKTIPRQGGVLKMHRREIASVKSKARRSYLAALAVAVLVLMLFGSVAVVLQRQIANGSLGQTGATPINYTLSSCANQPISVLVDLCTHQQLTDVQQSHTMGAYVIELERAYLDMNQLLITYRVFSQSTGKQIAATLTDTRVNTSQGFSFKGNGEAYPANGPDVVSFSTPTLPANTHTVQFQVKILALTPLLVPPQPGKPLQQPSTVNGSASFDFALPYHNGLVVTPHQTLKVDGISVTLARVLISPSETIVEGTTKGVIPGSSDYTFSLDAAGRKSSPAFSEFGGDSNPFRITYGGGLLDQRGAWMFEISSASGQAGPWVFHFSVP